MIFKLRAECAVDVDKFRQAIRVAGLDGSVTRWRVTGRDQHLPDVTLVFTSTESLEVLRHVLATVEDGHVMHETIAREADYTGKRAREPVGGGPT